ncbi:DNA-binding response regulator [Cohnella sp. JJ-181]|uniref:DNA-binding response regulator n=1 Tax=Cohnella rhizoplanae TaxID=2974897 RepID=UPI0022FFBD0A|nr:DNA-binding response regulator [Cohnella sp. JJ-181]CAI6083456.1 hypothetical protein COHCIP112018_04002 [Cohnella sp. JJ-181]
MVVDRVFEAAYDEMMSRAVQSSRGERRRRLTEGSFINEKLLLKSVWWPAKGNLNDLHPEYELNDYKDGQRFADFAYILPGFYRGLLLEADAYGTHLRDVSRYRYGDNLERQNHLLIDGWHILRFSRDDMLEKPKRCQQTLLTALSAWGYGYSAASASLDLYEHAILHWCGKQRESFKPIEVQTALHIGYWTAANTLRSLAEKGFLQAERSASGRSMSYHVMSKTNKLH